MIARRDCGRRNAAALGGLVLAATLSAADITAPSPVAAQTIAGEKVLLAFFDSGIGSIGGGAAQVLAKSVRFPSPEGALLGKVTVKPSQASAADAQDYPVPVRAGAEQALLGRREGRTL